MKASVDSDRCGGHAACMATCPEVFSLTDDGYAEVLVDEVPPELGDLVKQAQRQCPEHAISVTE